MVLHTLTREARMPWVGPYQVRACLRCGNPYCGQGNGSPGYDCPVVRREREDFEKVKEERFAEYDRGFRPLVGLGNDSCLCPKIGTRTIHELDCPRRRRG